MRKSSQRSLRYESLEQRQLFAADVSIPHNFISPEDCDNSGDVSPLDALQVINQLNSHDQAVDASKMLDVDADGTLSPLDALVVINHLNRDATGKVEVPSEVPVAARIARLQSAISNLTLPTNMTLTDAVEVLDTLKSGGHPELGERVIDGQMRSKPEVKQIEIERAVSNLVTPPASPLKDVDLKSFVERFADRLKDAGIDANVIKTISDEIKAGIDAKTPLTFDQIKARLTELGVDVSKIFPSEPPVESDPHHEIGDRLTGFIAQLKKAGVNETVVNTIVAEIRAGFESGSPLTIDQIRARLVELGVDVSKIFPPVPPEHPGPELGNRIQGLIERLKSAGVSVEVITTIVTEIKASVEAGTPLTADQVRLRLIELGVDVSKLFPDTSSSPTTGTATPIKLPIPLVTAILIRAKVPANVVEIVRKSMVAANEAGTPMSLAQLLALLKTQGVQIPDAIANILRGIR